MLVYHKLWNFRYLYLNNKEPEARKAMLYYQVILDAFIANRQKKNTWNDFSKENAVLNKIAPSK